jgi:hypothetical protein
MIVEDDRVYMKTQKNQWVIFADLRNLYLIWHKILGLKSDF